MVILRGHSVALVDLCIFDGMMDGSMVTTFVTLAVVPQYDVLSTRGNGNA